MRFDFVPGSAVLKIFFLAVPCMTVVIAGIVGYGSDNLTYSGFWWDETAQFFSSLGLPHYAEPGAVHQGVVEAIRMNGVQNLDPGGYTIIGHYWLRLGDSVAWIRALPFAFLMLAATGAGYLGWRLTRSVALGVMAFALPFTYDQILYAGLENRAYSMELAGVAVGVAVTLNALARDSAKSFLLLGAVCALFLTSRYSYVFCLFALLCMALFNKPFEERVFGSWTLKRLALAGAPLAVVGVLIFFFALRHQLWPEMTENTYLGLSAPVYTQGSVLGGNDRYLSLVLTNVLAPVALPITLAIVHFLFLQGSLHRFLHRRYGVAIILPREISSIYVFVLSIQAASVALSLAGAYPWDIHARWSAYLLMVSVLAVIALVGEIHHVLAALARSPVPIARPARGFLRGEPLLAISLSLVAAWNLSSYRIADETPWTNFAPTLKALERRGVEDRRVFVTRYDVPVVRFLYEYGPLENDDLYPDAFRFETDDEWRENASISASKEGIGFIVSGQTQADMQSRFTDARVVLLNPGVEGLYAVRDTAATGAE